MTIELGEYGYFKGDQWCRVGNIERIPGEDIFLHRIERSIAKEGLVSLGAEVQLDGKLEAKVVNDKAVSSISFSKKNSFYIKGRFDREECYDSVGMEVAGFLEDLSKKGIWRKNYRLVYSVVYSQSFLSIFSKEKGTEVSSKVDLTDGGTVGILKATTDLGIKIRKGAIEIVNNIDQAENALGFRLLSYEKNNIFSRKRDVKYKTDGQPEDEWDSEGDELSVSE